MATLSYKENTLLAYQHKEPEFFPMASDMDTCAPRGVDFIRESICVDGTANDWFGQSWTFEPNIGGANPTPGVHLVKDITKWRDDMIFPDLSVLDWEGYAARDTAHWNREHKLSRVMVGFGLWERMFSVMEFQDALCALLDEPEECYYFFSTVADHKVRLYQYLIKYYKPDILIMHNDYGSSGSMFMSPNSWRELIKPHLQRVINCITDAGVLYEPTAVVTLIQFLERLPICGAPRLIPCIFPTTQKSLKKKLDIKCALSVALTHSIWIRLKQQKRRLENQLTKPLMICSWVAQSGLKTPKRNAIVNDELIRYGSTKYTCKRPDYDSPRTSVLGGNPFVK
ncbi:hypothetical protein [Eubacterium aggregans]|uniref:hypothetical protein n=2 Tax=Eubacterium aggregans TaxID=81409 RepID=UPI003F3FBB29